MIRLRIRSLLLLALTAGLSCSPPPRADVGTGPSGGDGGSSGAPSAVGGPCQSNSDCATIFGTAACFTQAEGASAGVGAPGGYCTSSTCNATDPAISCGTGAVCGGFGGSGTSFCEAACSTSSPCRAGYECSNGGCVPGPPLPPDAGPMPSGDGGNNNTSDGGNNNTSDGGPNNHTDGGTNTDGGCSGGGIITGVVHAPTPTTYGAADPLNNVTVYIPGGTVEPFTPGVTCGACGMPLSGSPIVQTITGPDGSFTLTNTPVGTNIPLVVQVGRWRRQVQIPTVTACTPTAVSDDLTRLPRTHLEGDIPLIAMVTGSGDPFECVLRKIGIDDSEFTDPADGGRVQLYNGNGATIDSATPAETVLTTTPATLAEYDMVLFACEGAPTPQPTAAEQTNLIDYTTAGGRVLATHYSYNWLYNDQPFEGTADWAPATGAATGTSLTATIDQSFPSGLAFADWLVNVGASTTSGSVDIAEPRHDFTGVAGGTTLWMYTSSQPISYSFDTPVTPANGQQCGRVQFHDFHAYTSSGGGLGGGTFPGECDTTPMTSSEKALEFMLFDLEGCSGGNSPDDGHVPDGGISFTDAGPGDAGSSSIDAGPRDGGSSAADAGPKDGGSSVDGGTSTTCTGTSLTLCEEECAFTMTTCNTTTCTCN